MSDPTTDRLFLRHERSWHHLRPSDDTARYLAAFRGTLYYQSLGLDIAMQRLWHAIRAAIPRRWRKPR